MKPLYAITDELMALVNAADDGELTDEALTALESLQGDFRTKVTATCQVVRMLEAGAEAARVEANRLRELSQQREAAVERLKDYLKRNMELTGQSSVVTDLFKVRLQKNAVASVAVENADLAKWPTNFLKVVVEPDKKELADAAKRGGPLPDGVTVSTGTHLRIA